MQVAPPVISVTLRDGRLINNFSENRKTHTGKDPLILLCQIISVECPTNFEFGATFSIVVYALNWFWFVFDLV